MRKERASRAELNKDLRRILAKYHVDTSSIAFSASNYSVSLSGLLIRTDGSEFNSGALQPLVDELQSKYGNIDSDLSNWDLTGGSIRKLDKEKSSHEYMVTEEDLE